MKNKTIIIVSTALLLIGGCAVVSIVAGSGAAFMFLGSESEAASTPEKRPIQVVQLPTVPTNTATPTATQTPTPTNTPLPTDTATPVPTITPKPTDTPLPTPTGTPLPPTSAPPTDTPMPTDTPPPPFPFIIKETAQFPTNHANFDVYVAIVNDDNRPLSDYRVIGTHSGGIQVESQPSAGDWTVNSGANHYKGGNIKYEAPNSPSGVWTLQLVDSANTPVGPPVDFSFDAVNPTWYFIIYERQD